MNVLLTSAGRRSYLIKYFKEAVAPYAGEVHVSNSTKLCSSFLYADHTFVSPNIYSEEYSQVILSYCIKHEISLIIPLFDIDLLVLAKSKNVFLEKGITILVSDTEIVKICNDKWLTYNFLIENNFNTPKTYIDISSLINDLSDGQIKFPLIVKPRWGMGSIGVHKIDNKEELLFFNKFVRKQINQSYLKYESGFTPEDMVIFQEFIGGEEYGLDIVNDLNYNYLETYVKRKLAMRSGETDISEFITDHPLLKKLGEQIARKLNHIGNLDVDVLFDGREFKILEMNARFGGGYPFTHAMGVHLPKTIIGWLVGDNTNYLKVQTSNYTKFKSIEII